MTNVRRIPTLCLMTLLAIALSVSNADAGKPYWTKRSPQDVIREIRKFERNPSLSVIITAKAPSTRRPVSLAHYRAETAHATYTASAYTTPFGSTTFERRDKLPVHNGPPPRAAHPSLTKSQLSYSQAVAIAKDYLRGHFPAPNDLSLDEEAPGSDRKSQSQHNQSTYLFSFKQRLPHNVLGASSASIIVHAVGNGGRVSLYRGHHYPEPKIPDHFMSIESIKANVVREIGVTGAEVPMTFGPAVSPPDDNGKQTFEYSLVVVETRDSAPVTRVVTVDAVTGKLVSENALASLAHPTSAAPSGTGPTSSGRLHR
ncbi:MAG TPA: hypothetical protein VGK19_06690 [Capsulimonadaceae bacterium]|jgi:hypothetical protein